MKKYLLLMLLCCLSMTTLAQERKYYCEVTCTGKVFGGENAYIDLGGSNMSGLVNYYKNDNKPVDSDKKEIKFSSCSDVLNYMADRGWNLELVRYISSSEDAATIYTFSKTTTKEKLKEGIFLKGDK